MSFNHTRCIHINNLIPRPAWELDSISGVASWSSFLHLTSIPTLSQKAHPDMHGYLTSHVGMQNGLYTYITHPASRLEWDWPWDWLTLEILQTSFVYNQFDWQGLFASQSHKLTKEICILLFSSTFPVHSGETMDKQAAIASYTSPVSGGKWRNAQFSNSLRLGEKYGQSARLLPD